MTLVALFIILCTQLCAVTGQILVKKARALPDDGSRGGTTPYMVGGIAAMTVGFFLWLGLMSRFPLSYLFPFEALHFVFIMFAASIFLKEKATLSLWIGCILICLGIALVGAS